MVSAIMLATLEDMKEKTKTPSRNMTKKKEKEEKMRKNQTRKER
jgi:hypothetical protein